MVLAMRRRARGAPTERADDGSWAEQIDYHDLSTGHEAGRVYARRIDPVWVDKLARSWNPNKLDVLHVSFTDHPDHPLVTICGNHRLEAARKRGEPFKFWCIVYPGLTLAEEAEKFYAIDQDRKRHSATDGYHAALVFDDPKARDIDRILRAHGLSMATYATAAPKVGEVRSTGALYRAYDYVSPDIGLLDTAVGTIVSAWGVSQATSKSNASQPTVNGYTIEAMVGFLWRYSDLPQFNGNKLIRAMQRQEQQPYGLREYMSAMQRARVDLQKQYGKSGNQAIRFGMEVLIRLYNRKREADFRLPYRWVSLSRALVRSEKAAYLSAGLRGDTADNDL